MKKIIVFGFLCLLLNNVFSQKDSEAWKAEKTLESQYATLKKNASSWNGHVMIKEPKLNVFHKSILDTVKGLEQKVVTANVNLKTANQEIGDLTKKLTGTKSELENSISKESELVTLGMSFDKKTFPAIAYSIILLVLLIAVVALVLFFRSNIVTKQIEKKNQALLDDFQAQKASNLQREAKLARELQTERNKNNA